MPTHHGMKHFTGLHHLCEHSVNRADRFGRMFPHAPPLYVDPRDLAAIADKNGPMKSTGPAKKTSGIPVGHIFFGQFIDHDITLDLTSSFARLDPAEATINFRTPTLDLDSIYGDGPDGSPYLYHNVAGGGAGSEYNGVKILTGADMPGATALAAQDLARSAHGRAIIGDPRNDENRVISQMQLGFIRFHNRVAETLHAKGLAGHDLFEQCRRTVTWHYHWVVVNDFLRAMVGAPLLADIFAGGRKIYRPDDCPFGEEAGPDPFIPVEFAVAGFRFGHSMIPQRIQVQAGKPALDVFGATLGFGFSPLGDAKAVVEWPQLLDLGSASTDRADKLDTKLAADLLDLPFVGAGDVKSLALRNLLRGQAFRLPSGEYVAHACDRPANEIAKVTNKAQALAAAASPPATLAGATPLWLYILTEAAEIGRETSPGTFDKGEGLGPVGGRIVAETIIGLLELDDRAWLGSNRAWSPALADDKLGPNGVFTLLDLLTF
ncbi:peroxidase family protein [Sphingopyxis indica]|uniref:Animal haem peroxidase n=1 Tax=Sphingopyxis indica TaxID=436663 RepID=A0A239JJ16_9SPHN|nr:heme peroxidase family protein [Sphingopyxis indica]SNT05789.1 Animal haem peroxidase [Sphingopyxis indica]